MMWLRPLEGNEGFALYVIQRMPEWDRRECFATRWDDSDTGFLAEISGAGPLAWVAGEGVEPIAVFGCNQVWPGCWSLWFFATDRIRQIGISVTRYIKRVILPALFREGARRVESRSMEGHRVAQDWLGVLGARREATLRRYGRDGDDFHVYVWEAG